MSRRSYTWNGFETTLTSDLLAGSFTCTVATSLVLEAPLYMVLDPDFSGPTPIDLSEPAREWIKIVSWVGNTITIEDPTGRGLPGSYGPANSGSDHVTGAKMRAVFTKQLQDDLFDDIEDIESVTDDLAGEYLSIHGTNAMLATLTLSPGAPTVPAEATRLDYVEAQDNLRLLLTGGQMSGNIDMNSVTTVINLLNPPVNPGDAVPKDWVESNFVDILNEFDADDAVAAVAAADQYLKNTTDTLAGTLTVTTELKTNSWQAKNAGNDLVIQDGAGATILQWDDSVDEWEFKKNVDMEGHYLISPADPTAGTHVGDKSFNDLQYAPKSHTHSYLLLTGGTVSGTILSSNINPRTTDVYNLGDTSHRWNSIWLRSGGPTSAVGKINFGNNDYMYFDDTNDEWKFYADSVLRAIIGKNVTRLSGVMSLYDALPTFSSGGKAELSRRDSDGAILEWSSHPKHKSNARRPESFTERAKELVATAQGYIYGDKNSPDEIESVGLFSTEVAETFPELTHMVDGEPKSIHYGQLVTPILEVLRDYEARLAVLETV